MNMPNLQPLMPELVFTTLALIVLLLELFIKSKETVGLMVIVSVAITAYILPQSLGSTFSGMFLSDGYSTFFKFIFLLNLILTILISIRYIQIERAEFGEYYTILMFSTLGMMIMASSGDLIVLYLGLELMALSTYILAGFIRHDARSTEAALKYFLLGAFSSALLLYGIMLLYGLTGTTDILKLSSLLLKTKLKIHALFAIIMVLVAFSFKIALVPFHMWAPDVYEGAPTSITAFMSVGPKAAGFAVLGRVFLTGFEGFTADWRLLLIVLSIATMAVGNILAIQQQNLKRMLAYSSIAHAGYAVLGVIAGNAEGLSATMNYLLIYAFMNLGAFSVLVLLRNPE
ncbi:MAG: NADH-quinone oxidoreductase subunit N, partial [Nitrospirae bacterium]